METENVQTKWQNVLVSVFIVEKMTKKDEHLGGISFQPMQKEEKT